MFFAILTTLCDNDRSTWCMTLWSLWQGRNERVRENKTADANSYIWAGSKLLYEWITTRDMGGLDVAPTSFPSTAPISDVWKKSLVGWVKCNVESSLSLVANKVGLGMCLWDVGGNFIRAKTHRFFAIIDVLETIDLHLAINWVREMGFKDAIFELVLNLLMLSIPKCCVC